MSDSHPAGKLFAVSDLHVRYPENRKIVESIRPESDSDWLITAGDVAEKAADIEWALRLLSDRFARVIWVPGNHELWTPRSDPLRLRGERRYRHLVAMCQSMNVLTPEDPYPVWRGAGGPVIIAPLFVLYDYTFLPPGVTTAAEGLKLATDTGVVCSDEYLLHPEPYPGVADWCRARLAVTTGRLEARDRGMPTILVNHFPLVRHPTRILRYPQFSLWCGTEMTADWHLRFGATAVVYGHLHIPRTTWQDGVRFEEVSIGYPREWKRWQQRRDVTPGPRVVLPAAHECPPG
ncbi:MAG TPA: metallophosphoesterase [Streptosporangiaceae bacterium]|nr:metallophosphoesterase [Streptosporangiaceae bacterium]